MIVQASRWCRRDDLAEEAGWATCTLDHAEAREDRGPPPVTCEEQAERRVVADVLDRHFDISHRDVRHSTERRSSNL